MDNDMDPEQESDYNQYVSRGRPTNPIDWSSIDWSAVRGLDGRPDGPAVFTPWSPDRPGSQWRQAEERLVSKDVAEWLAEWFSKDLE